MGTFVKVLSFLVLFILSVEIAVAQRPDSYGLSINAASGHDSFTGFSASVMRSGGSTPVSQNEVGQYASIFYNRPRDILWASCAEGYSLTRALSRTHTPVLRLDPSDPTSAVGITYAGRGRAYNLTLYCSSNVAAAKKGTSDGWASFLNDFREAVRGRARSRLRAMMTSDFEWASDGNVGPDEALGNLDRGYVKWGQIVKSVNGRVVNCKYKDSSCWNFSGRTAKRTVAPEWLVFELGNDGRWRWARLVGD